MQSIGKSRQKNNNIEVHTVTKQRKSSSHHVIIMWVFFRSYRLQTQHVFTPSLYGMINQFIFIFFWNKAEAKSGHASITYV